MDVDDVFVLEDNSWCYRSEYSDLDSEIKIVKTIPLDSEEWKIFHTVPGVDD